MNVDEGLQVIYYIEGVILLYGTYSPVALIMVFVIYTLSYIYDSMSKRWEGIGRVSVVSGTLHGFSGGKN